MFDFFILKANMTENELFDRIVTFDKKTIMSSDIYRNHLLLLGSTQDSNSTIGQLPKELINSIVSCYYDLQSKDNDSFRFFKSLNSPTTIPDTFSFDDICKNCTIM